MNSDIRKKKKKKNQINEHKYEHDFWFNLF